MKVSWSKRALNAVDKSLDYIINEFGELAGFEFMQKIQQVSSMLERSPYAGKIEPVLEGKPLEYRSFVISRQNKIIYYVKKDVVRISALWDTRREPKKMSDEVK